CLLHSFHSSNFLIAFFYILFYILCVICLCILVHIFLRIVLCSFLLRVITTSHVSLLRSLFRLQVLFDNFIRHATASTNIDAFTACKCTSLCMQLSTTIST